MEPWNEYRPDVEGIHHTQKDAPSGTAISLAEEILKHSKKSLGIKPQRYLTIHAIRKEMLKARIPFGILLP